MPTHKPRHSLWVTGVIIAGGWISALTVANAFDIADQSKRMDHLETFPAKLDLIIDQTADTNKRLYRIEGRLERLEKR